MVIKMMKTQNITPLHVLEIFLMKEADEKCFYITLAKHVSDPEVRSFLNLMAYESTQHEVDIKKLLGTNEVKRGYRTNTTAPSSFIKEHFQTDIFPTGNDIPEIAPEFEGTRELLDFSLETELVTAEFYKLLSEHCEKISAKQALLLLEKTELERAEKIKSFERSVLEKSAHINEASYL